MNKKQEYEVGQKVRYKSGGSWKPTGIVVDKLSAIKMNNAVLSSAKYQVKWDESGEISGWLSYYDLSEE